MLLSLGKVDEYENSLKIDDEYSPSTATAGSKQKKTRKNRRKSNRRR